MSLPPAAGRCTLNASRINSPYGFSNEAPWPGVSLRARSAEAAEFPDMRGGATDVSPATFCAEGLAEARGTGRAGGSGAVRAAARARSVGTLRRLRRRAPDRRAPARSRASSRLRA